jgi:hypothetical protein
VWERLERRDERGEEVMISRDGGDKVFGVDKYCAADYCVLIVKEDNTASETAKPYIAAYISVLRTVLNRIRECLQGWFRCWSWYVCTVGIGFF